MPSFLSRCRARAIDLKMIVVRLRVRIRDTELAVRVVRRIHHRQHDVDVRRDLLPLLPHLERSAHGRHEPEDVGRGAHAELVEPRLRFLEVRRERVRLRQALRVGKHLLRQARIRLGKADVVELDLAEAQLRQLFGHADVVRPTARGGTDSPTRCLSCRARSSRPSGGSSTPDARAPSPNP